MADNSLTTTQDDFGSADDFLAQYKPAGASKPTALDYTKGVAAGVGGLLSGIGYVAEKVGAKDVGAGIRKVGDRAQDYWVNESMTPGGKSAAQSSVFEDDPNSVVPKLGENWGTAALMGAAQSAPSMLAAALPGGAAAGLLRAGAGGLARAGVGGATTALASGIASPVGSLASNLIGHVAARAPAAIGFGAAEGATAGAMNAAEMKSRIEQMPEADLLKSPAYVDLVTQHGPQVARAMLADQAAGDVFSRTTLSTGAIGALTGGGALGAAYQKLAGNAKDGFIKAALKGAGQEAMQETPQSGGERYITNLAERDYLDPSINPTHGVVADALSGGVVGGLMGGVVGAGGAGISSLQDRSAAQQKPSGALSKTVTAGEQSGAVQPIAGLLSHIPGSRDSETPVSFPDGSTGTRAQFDAWLSSLSEADRAKAMGGLLYGDQSARGATVPPLPADQAATATAPAADSKPAPSAGAQVKPEDGPKAEDATADSKPSATGKKPFFADYVKMIGEEMPKMGSARYNPLAAAYQSWDGSGTPPNPFAEAKAQKAAAEAEAKDITLKDGRPYKSESAAKQGAKKHGVTETHEPVAVKDGFVLRRKKSQTASQVAPAAALDLPGAVSPSLAADAAGAPGAKTTITEGAKNGTQAAQAEQTQAQEPQAAAAGAVADGNQGQAVGVGSQSGPAGRADLSGSVDDRRDVAGGRDDAGPVHAAAEGNARRGQANEPARADDRNAQAVEQSPPSTGESPVAQSGGTTAAAPSAQAATAPAKAEASMKNPVTPNPAAAGAPDADSRGGAAPAASVAPTETQAPAGLRAGTDGSSRPAPADQFRDATKKVDAAAHEAATSPENDKPEPTPAQKEAGNYAKGHLTLHGFDISIENPAGSERVAKDGSWRVTMPDHYGYIKGTVGADKDHVDVFIGKHPESEKVWIINQVVADSSPSKFDEHKVMLGYRTAEEAKGAYLLSFEGTFGARVFGSMTEALTIDQLKAKIENGDLSRKKFVGPVTGAATTRDKAAEAADAEKAANKAKLEATRKRRETAAAGDQYADKWFNSEEKANAFIAKNDIGDTHHVLKSATGRYVIAQKQEKVVAELQAAQEKPAEDLGAMFDDLMGELGAADEVPKAANRNKLAETRAKREPKPVTPQVPSASPTKQAQPEVGIAAARSNGRAAHGRGVGKVLPSSYSGAPQAEKDAWFAGWDEASQAASQRTAGQAAASAAKNTAEGFQNAIAGLGKLFGGHGRLSMGLSFDENTYEQAKPLFAAAVANFKQAGADIKDVMRAVMMAVQEQFGNAVLGNMKPYIVRYVEDVRDGKVSYDGSKEEASNGNNGTTGSKGSEALGEVAAGADGGTESRGDVRGGNDGSGKTRPRRNGNADGAGVPRARSGRGRASDVHSAEAGAGDRVEPAAPDLFSAPTNIPAANFEITADVDLGKGGEAVKFADNIAAIETLKTLERENRRATPEEQRTLARYVGWGGLSNAFADNEGNFKQGWEAKGKQLAELLTDAELKAARRSTRNAHYTSETIVRSMWSAAERLGFKGGMVLEPSSGTGNFLGMAPKSIAAKFIGVEFDSLTARIAQALYPQATILHSGFQKVALPDDVVDLAIGNPPFGSESLRFQFKPELNGASIHNQFFRASMDAVKPGGLQIMVVSRYLMDAQDSTTRAALARQAKLLGVIRLPDTAFKENARTEVVTDIVFLQKLTAVEKAEMDAAFEAKRAKPEKDAGNEAARRALAAKVPSWIETTTMSDPLGGEPMTVSRYVAEHPEMIVGTLERSGSMRYENDITVRLDKGADMAALLDQAIARLPANVMDQGAGIPEGIEAAHSLLSDALRIQVAGLEAGDIRIDNDGSLFEVIEREGPNGAYLLSKRTLTPESPWSSRLLMDDKGQWYEVVVKKDASGNSVKKLDKDGKPTKFNDFEKLVYGDAANVPKTLRIGESKFARLSKLVKIRDLLKEQLVLESENATAAKMEDNRARLNSAYDAFVSEHEHISARANESLISEMPDGALLLALEMGYRPAISAAKAKKMGESPRAADAKKAAILTERVVVPYSPPDKAESPADALVISMAEAGKVDLDRISKLLGTDEAGAIAALHGDLENPLIFQDPETREWQTADQYLSGQVKRKLAAAQAAGLSKNADALEKVQPEPWSADQVTAVLGGTWIPEQTYADFIKHLTGEAGRVRFSAATNSFDVVVPSTAQGKEWSTDDAGLQYILGQLLNSASIRLTYTDSEGNSHFMPEETALAQMKAKQIEAEFGDWIFADATRRAMLVERFNEKFNTRVTRQHDGSHLILPGKVPDMIIGMRRHQKNAIWRGIQERFMLLDHVVGAGKTFTAIARSMERRRMGLSKKPMIVVPNHMVEQFTADTYRLYPGAKVLAAGKADFEKKNRRKLFAKIATGDWDLVIVPHSSFKFVSISPEAAERYLDEEIRLAEAAIEEAWEQAKEDGTDNGWRKPFNVKQAEALREKLEARRDKLKHDTADRLLTFEQLGVDDLTVDEAHEFKNLYYSSRMTGVRGMGDRAGSEKAYDLYQKVRVLRDSPTGAVVFMTGTPISNSAVEMYTMMRYLAAGDLSDLGLEHFDAWRANFVDAEAAWEPTESGGLKQVTRLGRSWSNMRSLMDLYYSFTDAVSMDDIKQWYKEDNDGKEFPVPAVKGGGRQSVVVKPTEAQVSFLNDIVFGFNGLENIEDVNERNAERLRLMDRARKLSLDARAVDPSVVSDEKGGKLERVSDEVKRIYDQWSADRGTQLVFLDRSVPKAKGDDKIIKEYDKIAAERDDAMRSGDEAAYRAAVEKLDKYDANEIRELRNAQTGGWNAYQQIKDNLIARGIPANEIRFVQEANTDEQKQALFDSVNTGEVRVLIGSTPRMGAGTNVQQRLVALHHVDVTWKPSDIEQREGRIIRQGNRIGFDEFGNIIRPGFEVEILAYATERTMDAKMWDLNATKLRTINGIRKYSGEFTMEFEDEDAVGMAELAALASGDPLLLERVKIESELTRLEMLNRAWRRKMFAAKDRVDSAEREVEEIPGKIAAIPARIAREQADADAIGAEIERIKDAQASARLSVEGAEYASHMEAMTAATAAIEKQRDGNEKARFSIEVGGERITSKDALESAMHAAFGDTNPVLMTVAGATFNRRGEAAKAVIAAAKRIGAKVGEDNKQASDRIGQWFGMDLEADVSRKYGGDVSLTLSLVAKDGRTLASEESASIKSIYAGGPEFSQQTVRALFEKIEREMQSRADFAPQYWNDEIRRLERKLEQTKNDLPKLREQAANSEFPQAGEMAEKRARLEEIIRALAGETEAAKSEAQDGDASMASRTNRSLPENIRLEVQRDEDDEGTFVFAYDTSRKDATGGPLTVGHLHVPDEANRGGAWEIGDIQVSADLRRKGIASAMADRMSQELGGSPTGAASVFSADGKAFFGAYRAADRGQASRAASAPGLTPDATRAEIAAKIGRGRVASLIAKGLLRIHADMRTMPTAAQKYPDTWGWFDGQRMHIVAGNLAAGQAAGIFKHEAWHKMLRALRLEQSPLYTKLMDRLNKIEQNGAAPAWFRQALAQVPVEDMGNRARRHNEIAAYAIQQYAQEPQSLPMLVRRWAADMIAAVRAFFMDKLGWVPENLTPADLAALTQRYIRAMARGEVADGPMGGVLAARPDDGLASRPAAAIAQQATERVTDLFQTAKTFNLWHKSVGTQFHKASVDSDFARVFKIGQKFLQDTSQMAMDAADKAPDLLPKLGSLADVFKRGPKRADVDKVGEAIFNGTLNNLRYTDADLAGMGFTEAQRELYRQSRAAIDQSVDDLYVSDLVRGTRNQLPLLGRRLVGMSASDAHAAVLEGMDELIAEQTLLAQSASTPKANEAAEAKAADLRAQRKAMVDKFNRLQKLKDDGYAPLMRFGQYTVDVTETDAMGVPSRVFFGMFETEREANAVARKFKAAPEGYAVEQGVMSQEAWRMFQGVSPESLELFADAIGAGESEVFQEYLRRTMNNRSALKRLIHRQGIAGFSQDLRRVLATFITSNSRLGARNLNSLPLAEAVEAIPKAKGDVKDEAVKLQQYLTDPKEEASALRGWLFVHFIGGSVASALTNMTQPITMTAPFLAQYGTKAAGKALAFAAKTVSRKATGNPRIDAALKKAEAEGITAPHEIHQLYAESIRSLGSNLYVRKALTAWGQVFALAEAFNRRLTFIAAYQMALDDPALGNPFAFAERAVEETQGVYNKGNRPNWARGAVGATIFTFKQFSIAYLEFLKRLPPKQRALALAILFMAAGLQGWPFAEDIQDLIDTIGQSFGYNTNSKRWMHEFAVRQLGEGFGEFVVNGASAIPGVPIDVQARMGLGNLIPGSGFFKVSGGDKSRDVLEFVGPAGALAGAAVDSVRAVQGGRYADAMLSALPVAAKNFGKGVQMGATGEYRDTAGRKVMNVDGFDATMKGVGFQPVAVAKESRKARGRQQDFDMMRAVEDRIADRWAHGLIDKDPDAVRAAKADLARWNERNPESRIIITPQQVIRRVKEAKKTREERFLKSAPSEIRGQVAREFRDR